MNWQQIISLAIVVVTVFLFILSFVQKRRRSALGFCDDECGCSASDLVKKIPPDRLKQLHEQQRHRSLTHSKEGQL